MLRCMQTAMEFSQVLGLPIKVEPAAMEAMDERWYPIIPVCYHLNHHIYTISICSIRHVHRFVDVIRTDSCQLEFIGTCQDFQCGYKL